MGVNGRGGLVMRRTGLALAFVMPVALLLYGLWTFPLSLFGPDRSRIPGDRGDARFNNYVLEHFHRWAHGEGRSYWDAPFMHPHKNVTALSDNLLGTAPIYSVLRTAGSSRSSAFQSWILSMFLLNYVVCFLVLWRWTGLAVVAACGAYVFAFGIQNIGHLHHAQVFPRFMVPVAFFHCLRWLETSRPRHLFLLLGSVVFQFYCGMYLGFMLCYALFFLLVAHAVFQGRTIARSIVRDRRTLALSVAALLIAGLALMPLAGPYWEASRALPTRAFAEVRNSVPRLASYFFTHPAALNWQGLSGHSKSAFEEWWHHFHFMGGVPWCALLIGILLPQRFWPGAQDRRVMLVLALGWGLSTVFCLRIGDHTLWKLVHQVPGFNALRSIDRIMNVQAMFVVMMMVWVFARIPRRTAVGLALAALLPLATVLDQRLDVSALKYFDKYAADHAVREVERQMRLQGAEGAPAIAYCAVLPVSDHATWHERLIGTHLDAMLAAQHLGVPVVNAYTGNYPGNYMLFFDRMDRSTLADWFAFNGRTTADLAVIWNTGEEVIERDTIWIKAANDRYLSVDSDSGTVVLANRKKPAEWEVLLRVRLEHDRSAFVTHTGNFLCAEMTREAEWAGTAERLGDMGIFREVRVDSSTVAWLADNGRYLSLDTVTGRVRAVAAGIGPLERFTVLDAGAAWSGR